MIETEWMEPHYKNVARPKDARPKLVIIGWHEKKKTAEMMVCKHDMLQAWPGLKETDYLKLLVYSGGEHCPHDKFWQAWPLDMDGQLVRIEGAMSPYGWLAPSEEERDEWEEALEDLDPEDRHWSHYVDMHVRLIETTTAFVDLLEHEWGQGLSSVRVVAKWREPNAEL